MKKLKVLIILLLGLIFIPNVYASTDKVEFTGSNNLIVNHQSNIYVKLNTTSSFDEVSLSYAYSGSIKVVGSTAIGGMSEVSNKNGNVKLSSTELIPSGTAVLAITVSGEKVGTGVLTISGIKVKIDGKSTTVNANTFTITVVEESKETELLDETTTAALNKATILVEAAEKSLLRDDYESAASAVDVLVDSTEKTNLLKRIQDVKFNVELKETCDAKETNTCSDTPQNVLQTVKSNTWILICCGLAVCLLVETIVLIFRRD